MAKRGEGGIEISLYFFLELAAAVFVGAVLANTAVSYARGTVYEKLNIAENIGMQMNTMISFPDNADAYLVTRNLHGYSISIIDNKVEVFSEIFDTNKVTYYFPTTGSSDFDVKLIKPKQIVISKIKDKIIISDEIPNEFKNA